MPIVTMPSDEESCILRIQDEKKKYDDLMKRVSRLDGMRKQYSFTPHIKRLDLMKKESLLEAERQAYLLMRLDRQRYNTFGGLPPQYMDLSNDARNMLEDMEPKQYCEDCDSWCKEGQYCDCD